MKLIRRVNFMKPVLYKSLKRGDKYFLYANGEMGIQICGDEKTEINPECDVYPEQLPESVTYDIVGIPEELLFKYPNGMRQLTEYLFPESEVETVYDHHSI